jgi:hypothetical protein
MSFQAMKSLFPIAALVMLILICTSCRRTGFQVVNGKPAYVTWDEGNGTIIHELEGGDAKTFVTLFQGPKGRTAYAKDASHVYFSYQHAANQIDGADPGTFTVLDQEGWYSKDRMHAYYFGAQIERADSASFKSLPYGYAKDDKRVYIGTLEIPVTNVAVFEPLNHGFCDDPWRREGTGGGQPSKWFRRKTSALLASGWSRDASTIFYGANAMPKIDPKTFSDLGRYYAKDANNVYFAEKVIGGADPATFQIDPKAFNEAGINLGPGPDAHDKNHQYSSGRILK